jgi:hypothetical protein
MKTKSANLIERNKIFYWLGLATGLILLIPLIAMQFSSGVNWTLSDFLVAAVLLFGAGSLFVLSARKTRQTSKRVILGVLFAVALLYVWAELAVGVFTNLGS